MEHGFYNSVFTILYLQFDVGYTMADYRYLKFHAPPLHEHRGEQGVGKKRLQI